MPNPHITVDGLVWFDGVGDVLLTPKGKDAVITEPDRVLSALRIAVEYSRNEVLRNAAQGHGPLAGYTELEIEELVVLLEDIKLVTKQETGARQAKIEALRLRRSQFGANRAALVLKMLAAGTPYRCTHPGCMAAENLTVDHKLPISVGGTDDVENLQFMCLSHNAAKGARI